MLSRLLIFLSLASIVYSCCISIALPSIGCCGGGATSWAYAPPQIVGYHRIPIYQKVLVPVPAPPPPPAYPAPPMPIPQPSSYSSVPIQPISIPSQITAPNYQQPQVQVSSNYQEQPVVQQQQPLDSSAPAPFAPSSSQTVASVQNADQTFFSSPSEGGSSYNDVSASSPVAADPANNGGYLVII
ncbi:hypothetical protein WR25_23889 isoform B [Diploscapter pachys]|uniref:Uncharacterized protein n=1 Tax=Diploscapter pachys TaxID=2018661 RepID=A0A2A2L170_9BILA|nr:hypothetical protein WR25_23889 isoform B [Diploscapter pachys]